jgi:hypothetical protein
MAKYQSQPSYDRVVLVVAVLCMLLMKWGG